MGTNIHIYFIFDIKSKKSFIAVTIPDSGVLDIYCRFNTMFSIYPFFLVSQIFFLLYLRLGREIRAFPSVEPIYEA